MEGKLLERIVGMTRERLGGRLADITVERAVFGLFFSGVKLSTGHGGLCFTPVKEMPEAVCCPSSAKTMPLSGKLAGRPVEAYLEDAFSPNILKRALGIATLNALTTLLWELEPPTEYTVEYGADAFETIDLDRHEKCVVVGALIPMIRKMMAKKKDFHILEQDPRTLKEREMPYYLPAEEAYKVVPDADLLVITGVTVLNDTLPGLLEMAKPGAEIVVTGPTVSMMPEAFLEAGVTTVGGLVVTDADRTLDLIAEGGSGYHFFGKTAERTVVRAKA